MLLQNNAKTLENCNSHGFPFIWFIFVTWLFYFPKKKFPFSQILVTFFKRNPFLELLTDASSLLSNAANTLLCSVVSIFLLKYSWPLNYVGVSGTNPLTIKIHI